MTVSRQPSYLALAESGELNERAETARRRLACCDICPRACGVDRLRGETGACGTAAAARVASFAPHFGEEGPLVGRHGSGTIFFSGCNLTCLFCQNHDISQLASGPDATPQDLTRIMLRLQALGCHNINLVSPSHVVPQLLAAVALAAGEGLHLPLVYNTGGYDSLDTLRLLDGVFDIYMPDMKYADDAPGLRYSGVPDYPAVNQAAVREMHRQVGDLELDPRGIALRGLLVRHLVLPAGEAGTARVAAFLADEVSRDTYINVMAQYRPCYRAGTLPPLDRALSRAEFADAVEAVRAAGLHRLDRRRL